MASRNGPSARAIRFAATSAEVSDSASKPRELRQEVGCRIRRGCPRRLPDVAFLTGSPVPRQPAAALARACQLRSWSDPHFHALQGLFNIEQAFTRDVLFINLPFPERNGVYRGSTDLPMRAGWHVCLPGLGWGRAKTSTRPRRRQQVLHSSCHSHSPTPMMGRWHVLVCAIGQLRRYLQVRSDRAFDPLPSVRPRLPGPVRWGDRVPSAVPNSTRRQLRR